MTEPKPPCPDEPTALPCPELPGCAVARTPSAPPQCRAPGEGLMAMPRPVLLNDGLGSKRPQGPSTDTKGRPRGQSIRPEEALDDVA